MSSNCISSGVYNLFIWALLPLQIIDTDLKRKIIHTCLPIMELFIIYISFQGYIWCFFLGLDCLWNQYSSFPSQLLKQSEISKGSVQLSLWRENCSRTLFCRLWSAMVSVRCDQGFHLLSSFQLCVYLVAIRRFLIDLKQKSVINDSGKLICALDSIIQQLVHAN